MQPVAHGKRGALALIILSAVILAGTLLLALRATAASALSGEPSSGPAAVSAPLSGSGPINAGEALPRASVEQVEFNTSNMEIVGIVVNGPTTGYVGTWQIQDSGTVVNVVVNSSTSIKGFNNLPPGKNTWVEAKVSRQADGSFLATKFRPNKFQPGEIVARLTETAMLTDVLNTYRQYRLIPLESLLSSGKIYRFAIAKNLEESTVAAALAADKANFVWAEVNAVSEISPGPVGNPYRTWKWGSSDDSSYVNQNALQQIDLLPVQGVYSGTNVIIAVLDTGLDATHPAFVGRVLPGTDLVSDDAVPQDGPEPGQRGGLADGHGTHVSGIAALVAPESMILPVRVLDVDGRGNTFVLAYAVDWAVAHGASVINMSLGSDSDSTVLEEAIARAQSQGVLVTAAAGNDNWATPQYPALYPGVLGVTAVDDADHKADFANYGTGWVDLAAPGVAITSTVPVSGSTLYAAWSGTSMAVPFVSGAAALLRQSLPGASPAQISDLLIQAGRDADALNPTYAGQIGRLLDVGAALPGLVLPASTSEPTPTVPESTPLPTPIVAATTETTGTVTPVPPDTGVPGSTPVPPTPVFEATPTSTPTPTPTKKAPAVPTAAPTAAATQLPGQTQPTPLPPQPTPTATAQPTQGAFLPEALRPYLFLPSVSR